MSTITIRTVVEVEGGACGNGAHPTSLWFAHTVTTGDNPRFQRALTTATRLAIAAVDLHGPRAAVTADGGAR